MFYTRRFPNITQRRNYVFKKLIAVFFAFLAVVASAGFANAQEYAETLRLVRGTDGMTIELKKKTTNGAGTAFYLYTEIGYWNADNKRQDMNAVGYILGLGGDGELIHDGNRSRIMNEPSTGRNYKVSLPTLGELRNLRSVHGGLPRQWNGYLDGGPEFLTASKNGYRMHQTLNLANGEHNTRWDSGQRVVALTVQEEVSDNRVCFYEHTNYQGKSKCFTAGNYTDLGNYPSEGGPAIRTFSSAKAGAKCYHTVLNNAADWYNLVLNERAPNFDMYNMNDRGISVEVTCTQDLATQDPYSVCFFEHANYKGRSKCFTNGSYPTVGFYGDGLNADNTFSSYSIGAGCKGYGRIIFYTGENYTGSDSETAVGNSAATDPVRRQPVLDQYWNDRFSSILFNCLRP